MKPWRVDLESPNSVLSDWHDDVVGLSDAVDQFEYQAKRRGLLVLFRNAVKRRKRLDYIGRYGCILRGFKW